MNTPSPTLHMLCGKIASGKSTLATRLGKQAQTVIIAEDAWLSALFSDQIATITDYVDRSERLKSVMAPHISQLLDAGLSVVLDYPANTKHNRAWLRRILDDTDADHALHVIDASDETCLERLRTRNAQGDHPFAATEAQFHQITKHYQPPTPDEGFSIVYHRAFADQ